MPETRWVELEASTIGMQSIPWGVGAESSTASPGSSDHSKDADEIAECATDDLRVAPTVKIMSMLQALLILQRQREVVHKQGHRSTPSKGFYAILNDFGLDAVMNRPERKGSERIGTKQFMATDLLSTSNETLCRLYGHDLESIIWCLAWYCKPEKSWKNECLMDIYRFKLSWAHSNLATPLEDIRKEAAALWRPALCLVKAWTDMLWSLGGGEKVTDGDNMRLVHGFFPYPERPDQKRWNSQWMDRKISTVDDVGSPET
ncbi:hypothetical protein EST38_g1776 [Candolleomyces aberdarensis]|uniref:Fungal-type protein kinase domain-containing protein n=1 Tax=Candolleomyces aberdarensis TaxID=2316362 RepID=A0A4Q2DU43_9AGAR|nr:hypothetical protein EST38_g1776 [Candolleomyces aberdarensis]